MSKCCVCGTTEDVGKVCDVDCCYNCYQTGALLTIHPEFGKTDEINTFYNMGGGE
jgi:hypothetical protein